MIDVNSLIEKLIEQYKNNLNETQVIEIRNSYIKTVLNPLYSQLKSVPNEQKGELGKSINELKIRINEISDAKIEEVRKISEISDHKVDYDISIETSLAQKGSLNPLTLVLNEIIKYFKNLNFTIQTGEEITKVKYNFDHLNVPEIHPTRDTSESFYINATTMLRTQNTATSAEVLENNSNSDIRIMNYGYVYRNDDDDASHSHQFNQIDFI
jgi:phenylalanyl-tRNA synthetase alpha chain